MISYSKEDFISISKWYHGTTKLGAKNVIKHVDAHFNHNNALDFGWGFYLCPQKEWALNYINNILNTVDEDTKIEDNDGYVIEFEFVPKEYVDDYNFMFYDSLNSEFAEFVFRNREYYKYHLFTQCIHKYDYIGGPMSDGKQLNDFHEYHTRHITKEELYKRLLLPKESWQLSLHSQSLCDKLKVTGIYNLKGERVYEIV